MNESETEFVITMREEHRRHEASLCAMIESLLAERRTAWDEDVRALVAVIVPGSESRLSDDLAFAMTLADKIEEGRQERAKKRREEKQSELARELDSLRNALGTNP